MTKEAKAGGPAWFSIREAAAYLQVGEPTIYRWMRDGRITYRKVGDSTRFLQQDLDALVAVFPSTKAPPTAPECCAVCRHDVLVEGDLRSTGLVRFHPRRPRFWTLKEGTVKTRALACARCGAITLQADPTALAALRQPAGDSPSDEPATGASPPDEPAPGAAGGAVAPEP